MHRTSSTGSVARALGTLAVAVILGASGILGDPSSVIARARPSDGPGGALAWLNLGAALALPVRPLLEALGQDQSIDEGSDGRLTVLLLGSDARGSGVARTDTIMIMSLKGNTINAASIPRDTSRILNPYTANPSDYFSGRVNAIVKQFKNTTTTAGALSKFEFVIERLLGIEIDYYALINFNGFQLLVDDVDPISINVRSAIRDTKFWDDPNLIKGAYFPAATAYSLYAWQPNSDPPLCNGTWRNYANPPASTWCHRAIVYVRTRKGAGNSDFKRARRQQDFVGAAIRRVAGLGSGSLSGLIGTANDQVGAGALVTNIPFNSSSLELFSRLYNANLGAQVVFAPPTYSTHIPGTTAYQLKLSAVRAWAAIYLK